MDKFDAFPLWVKILFGIAIIIHTFLFYGAYEKLRKQYKTKKTAGIRSDNN